MKGDLVVLDFPFPDGSGSKRRPAVIVAELEGRDCIFCSITRSRSDKYSVDLSNSEMDGGRINTESKIRPNLLFTMEKRRIDYRIGHLKEAKIKEVEEKLVDIFTQ